MEDLTSGLDASKKRLGIILAIAVCAWVLFSVQFMWQFPHFWAIAWVSHDDYKKAGFFMFLSGGWESREYGWYLLT